MKGAQLLNNYTEYLICASILLKRNRTAEPRDEESRKAQGDKRAASLGLLSGYLKSKPEGEEIGLSVKKGGKLEYSRARKLITLEDGSTRNKQNVRTLSKSRYSRDRKEMWGTINS